MRVHLLANSIVAELPAIPRLDLGWACGLAISLSVTTFYLIQSLPAQFEGQQMLMLFTLPMLVSALFGGFVPGILASLIALVSTNYLLNIPLPDTGSSQAPGYLLGYLFIAYGLLVSILGECLFRLRCQKEESIRALAEEIRARQSVEEALQRMQARWTAIFQQESMGIMEADAAGKIVSANESLCRILGLGCEQLLNRSYQDLFFAEDLPKINALYHLCISEKEDFAADQRFVRSDGSEVWLRVQCSALPHPNCETDPAIATVFTLSEMKPSQPAQLGSRAFANRVSPAQDSVLAFAAQTSEGVDKLREKRSAQGQTETENQAWLLVVNPVVSAIAHEINQPLNSIASYSAGALNLIQKGNPPLDKLVWAMQQNINQVMRTGLMMRELFAFLREFDPRTQSLNIGDLTSKALAQERDGTLFDGFDARLDLSCETLPKIQANLAQVEKVLFNLIRNSIEAMRRAGHNTGLIQVKVGMGKDERFAHFSIHDNGPGLSGKSAQQVFEPFFTTKSQGLGMGLVISRAFVEAQGGELWTDAGEKTGASFHFTLPFAEGEEP